MKKKEDWKIEKLGDVCIIERGGSPRPIEKYITSDKNGINWIKIGDAKEGTMIISSTKERIKPEGMSKSRFVRKGDFILSNSMSFGKPYILGVDGCIHDGWLVIRDEKGVFDKSFLYYFLGCKYTYQTFKKMAVGGVVNNLNSKMVRGLMIPIPPLPIQQQIVSELDALSDIISKKKQQIEELDKLAQAAFYDMFGDPLSNEKGWKFKVLSQLVSKLGDGIHGTPKYSEEGDYWFVNGNNLKNGTIKFFANTKRVDVIEYEKYKVELNDNTILVSINGTLGNVAFYNGEKIMLGKSACYFNVLETVNKSYLFHIIKSSYFAEYANNESTGTTIKNVSLKSMRNFPIPVPPIVFQNEFVKKIDSIEVQKALINKSIGDVQQLFDYTMDKYFN